jgi:parvulin-like peptidyl-prolyl isomerase
MADRRPFRSLTLAAFALAALGGCSRPKDESTLTPVPAASTPPTTAEAPAAPPASSSPAAPSTPKSLGGPPVQAKSPVPPGVDPKKPVATVNGKPITAEKVYSVYRMNEQMLRQRGRVLNPGDDQALRAQSLEVVIADELLYQAAVAQGVTASPAEIEAALKQLKARLGTEATYKRFLMESGLTEAAVRHEVTRNIQTDAYGKGLLAGKGVSEEQAKKFYDANAGKGMFNVPEQVHVQYILVKAAETDPESVRLEAKKRAEEAAKRAAAGEDFAALAKQYSQDQTAARGGDIGFFPRGVMFPKFEEVAFAGKPGEVTPIFETPKGFNVMKVLEKKPESTRTYDEVKDALMADLGRVMEQDALKAKVRELAAAAKIAVLDPAFRPPPTSAPAIAGKP